MKIIEIDNLSKNFKNFKAVDGLSLSVDTGEVFGFLGPNGAGKSTTIRMILSLIKPTGGSIKLFGKTMNENDRSIYARIGALVEKPDFYNYLTAYRNIEIFASLSKCKPTDKMIYEILELVGLKGREKDKVKTYSLGMKQRLGLAQALIHKPDLLILDEPTNGLDPQGMKEIRELILKLSSENGMTIFLSSHILKEVETIASSMAIINKGKTAVQGKVSELLKSGRISVNIEILNYLELTKSIKESDLSKNLKSSENAFFNFESSENEITHIVSQLVNMGAEIRAVVPKRTLEDYFMEITGGTQ